MEAGLVVVELQAALVTDHQHLGILDRIPGNTPRGVDGSHNAVLEFQHDGCDIFDRGMDTACPREHRTHVSEKPVEQKQKMASRIDDDAAARRAFVVDPPLRWPEHLTEIDTAMTLVDTPQHAPLNH